MRRAWIVGVLLVGVLLGACADPSSGPEGAPASPGVPASSATTEHRRPAASARASAKAPGAPAKAPTVLYLGDSLAMENQRVLGEELRRDLRARYTSAPYSGTTLCDYLEGTGEKSLVPDRDKAAALVRSLHPDYVVLQFWGNAWDYTWCMDGITHADSPTVYFKRYAADARRLTEQIAKAGGDRRPRIVWVAQPTASASPSCVRSRSARRRFIQRPRVSGSCMRSGGSRLLGRARTVAEGTNADCQRFWLAHCSTRPRASVALTADTPCVGVPWPHRSRHIHRQMHPWLHVGLPG